jgi:hypothetical protein
MEGFPLRKGEGEMTRFYLHFSATDRRRKAGGFVVGGKLSWRKKGEAEGASHIFGKEQNARARCRNGT